MVNEELRLDIRDKANITNDEQYWNLSIEYQDFTMHYFQHFYRMEIFQRTVCKNNIILFNCHTPVKCTASELHRI